MSRLKIAGGTVYDPANGIDGEVRDLYLEDGRVVEPPAGGQWEGTTLEAGGYAVLPGAIDMHCHIAGPKVNAGRQMLLTPRRPRNHSVADPSLHGAVPTTVATGNLFAAMGYTTAMDAAIPGLLARHAHQEMADTPHLDKGFYLLSGNNHYLMEQMAAGNQEAVNAYCGWAINAAKAYALKIVNPGGIENWKQIQRMTDTQFEEPIPRFGVTPRQIVRSLAAAADSLGLPHPVHVHTNNLGIPGNWETTLRTMQSLEGHRGHIAHIQFHSYGGSPDDPRSFASATEKLFDYVRDNQHITIDVGHVHPGRTLGMTGDTPSSRYLRRLTGNRWFTSDCELESSCGVIPVEYRPQKSLIHSVQWAIALEWYLLMLVDPWRVALTSDHPNGGAFYRYPEMIHLLMDADFRREAIERMPAGLGERSLLGDLADVRYGLNEIAIITRAAPARMLGLSDRGHLGLGAAADVAIYTPQDNKTAMFARPRWVVKGGRVVAEDGELRSAATGSTLHAACQYDRDAAAGIQPWFRDHYCVQYDHYHIQDEEVPRAVPISANA